MKSLLAFATLGLLLPGGIQAASLSDFPLRPTNHTTVDSIGVEKRDGKRFILHRVNQGQTLYAIARRYNTSVEVIKSANPDLKDALQYNQVVRIPLLELSRREERAAERAARREEKAARKADKDDEQLMKPTEPASKTETRTAKPETKEAETRKAADTHVVEPGQTLYSLAVKYQVLMADLRRWNNLTSDNIQLGQTLIVSEKGFTARNASRPANTEAAKTEPAAKAPEPKPEAPKKELAKAETKPEAPARPAEERPIRPGESGNNLPAKGRRMAEIGMAERIDSDDSSNKYLALHRTAPIGSLVQVRNDISNQSLWVKVIGRLPNTGVNERVLIKLSSKAFSKLSPNNQSFRAEVSYIVP